MREIKFRAWDKPSSTMYQWEVVKRWGNIFDDNSKIVMQYTGLKDIRGQEIYEGDQTTEGLVIFEEGCFWLLKDKVKTLLRDKNVQII